MFASGPFSTIGVQHETGAIEQAVCGLRGGSQQLGQRELRGVRVPGVRRRPPRPGHPRQQGDPTLLLLLPLRWGWGEGGGGGPSCMGLSVQTAAGL